MSERPMDLVVVTPHLLPDTAPTGAVVTRIVEELSLRGHRIEVITSLPWYRDHQVEEGYGGRLVRVEDTPWGRVTRVHPFPSQDKRNIPRRALSFAGFSTIVAAVGRRGPDVDGVLAVSPPLTLGLDGWTIARARRARFIFNIQDVFPDVAIELGVLKSAPVIAAARRLERFCYSKADAITVLSEDLKRNLTVKTGDPDRIHVIPNFVDTRAIQPVERENAYRKEFGLTGKTVVMYAGNVGLSQSLELLLHAAARSADREDIVFVINGQGSGRSQLEAEARGLNNVRFVDSQPSELLPEVLGAADIHVVPLKKGLAASSVPSKTYSVMAAGRPLIASVDPGTEIARLVERSGAGLAVPPEDPDAFWAGLERLLDDPDGRTNMGEAGRSWVETWASAGAVAEAYESLFRSLGPGPARRRRVPAP